MTYIKLDANGVVIYKTPYSEEGTIEAPDTVVCGMIKSGANYIIQSPTLDESKSNKTKEINNAADLAFNQITSPYPKQEISTWPNQYAEAWALQADPLAYCPTLTNISLVLGVTVQSLATSVLQKAAAYTVSSGAIIGKRKLLTDQIIACTTNAQVEAIVW